MSMTTTSATTATAPAAAASSLLAPSAGDAEQRFLAVLVAQMKNQDPLNPLDNAQVTSQLAQISTVSGIEQLNRTLSALRTDMAGASSLQAVSLAGRQVLVNGDLIALAGGSGEGGFELAQNAERVTVSILDGSGRTVHSADLGPQTAGMHRFTWDGRTDTGASAASGAYSFRIQAVSSGKDISAQTLSLARVDGVSRSATGVTLNVGALGSRSLADIRQVL